MKESKRVSQLIQPKKARPIRFGLRSLPKVPIYCKRWKNFEFVNNPVSQYAQNEVKLLILSQKGFWGPLNESMEEEFRLRIAPLPITFDQAISLRKQVLVQKSLQVRSALERNGTKIIQLYNDGHSVIDLAKSFDFPPVNIIRKLLSLNGMSPAKIRMALKDPEVHLSERDRMEFQQAEANDLVSCVFVSDFQSEGFQFEKVVTDYFTKRGVSLMTHQQLDSQTTEKERWKDCGYSRYFVFGSNSY